MNRRGAFLLSALAMVLGAVLLLADKTDGGMVLLAFGTAGAGLATAAAPRKPRR